MDMDRRAVSKFFLLCVVLLGLQSSHLLAAVPQSIHYQAVLTDTNGVPISGNKNVAIFLLDAPTGGNTVGGNIYGIIPIQDGLISLDVPVLGASALQGGDVWLEIEIDGEIQSPRQRVNATPFALLSEHAETADAANSVEWSNVQNIPADILDGDSDNSASWLNISGVPADLADGDDDNSAIWSNITGIPADIADGDADSGGDITAVTVGAGLTGGGTDGDVSLAVDSTAVQNRVTGACLPSGSIGSIAEDGTVNCLIDQDTTYSAGDNLSLNGTQFNVEDGSGSGLNADLLDGFSREHFSFTNHKHRIGARAVVAASGGDYTSVFDALHTHVIDSWCGTPALDNPCVIQMMPGVYDFGNQTLVMPDYVYLLGSGKHNTKILSSYSNGVIKLNSFSDTEIRDLSIETSGVAEAIVAGSATQLYIKNVAVKMLSSSGAVRGLVCSGLCEVDNFELTIGSSSATSTTGVHMGSASNVVIRDSRFSVGDASGPSLAIAAPSSGGHVELINSTIDMTGNTGGNDTLIAGNFAVLRDLQADGLLINGNTIFVPGNIAEAGEALLRAFEFVSNQGGGLASKPYLIKLDAGIFDVADSRLTMSPYLDLQGSGENATFIKGDLNDNTAIDDALITAAGNSSLSDFTVENTGGGTYSIAIFSSGSSNTAKIRNVTARVSGGQENFAILLRDSAATLNEVSAQASGGTASIGVFVYSYYGQAIATLNDVVAKGAGASSENLGVKTFFDLPGYPHASNAHMSNVSSNGLIINGRTISVPATDFANYSYDIANGKLLLEVNNQLQGFRAGQGVSSSFPFQVKLGTGTYSLGDEAYEMLPYVDLVGSGSDTVIMSFQSGSGTANTATIIAANDSQVRNLRIEQSASGTDAVGIYVNGVTNFSVKDVEIEASGGSNSNYGIRIGGTSEVTVDNVDISVSGGNTTFGVFNLSSTSQIKNSKVRAFDGTNNRGVYLSGSNVTMDNVDLDAPSGNGGSTLGVRVTSTSTAVIRNSVLGGDSNSIESTASSSTKIANTQLGDSVLGTTFTCVGVYDASFAGLNTACQ